MEKIYMEESKRQKKSIMNLSVVLSFVVSIFAVFSLAMFGIVMNQGTGVSYAAPDGTDFNLRWGAEIHSYTLKEDGETEDKMYDMINYYAGDTNILANQVFCIERKKTTENNNPYKATDEVRSGATDLKEDTGLMYLLGIGKTGKAITEYGSEVDGYVLQSAIWYYLAEKYPNDETYKLRDETDQGGQELRDKAVMDYAGTIYLEFGSTKIVSDKISGPNGYISKLVNEAKAYAGNTLTVNIGDSKPAKTEDGKYYQSPVITPVGTNTLVSYDVEVSGIEGIVVVNENGEEISSTNIPAGTKFYVRIPADKVSKESQTVKINVKGLFNNGGVHYYATENVERQRLAYVTPVVVPAGAEFAIVGDTGMNVAQTIYFIGLVVLLCGVGIVYANAKPVEAKQ